MKFRKCDIRRNSRGQQQKRTIQIDGIQSGKSGNIVKSIHEEGRGQQCGGQANWVEAHPGLSSEAGVEHHLILSSNPK
ncbi:hypothetical protein CEXT_333341 [Caerostris extrusa]|uniref:Uncharacterized protein n=1 Tax=Caerostris extrusa TaxID=172846 RepID=A0AAV4SWH7_CAEEX|nr:hypothetical protein CEXT_333341 [Caerostris extrusa]